MPASRRLMAAGRELADRHRRSISIALRLAPPLALAAWIAATYWYAANSLPLPNIACPQDLGLMLDAGWRYYQGLRAHADYHTPLGPLFAMVFGVPMRLFGPSYSSLQFLPPTLSALAAVWTWLICRRSLSPWLATFTAMGMGAITGGIYHLGFPPEALTFATIYNRIGFGVLGTVALAAMLPRTSDQSTGNRFMDYSMAVGLIGLAFFKANFAVAAIPFVLCSAFIWPRTRRDWCFVSAVSSLVLMFCLYQIGFRIDKMWADLTLAGKIRRDVVGLVFHPLRNAWANYDFFLLLALNSILWLPRYQPDNGSWKQAAVAICVIWAPTLLGLGLTCVSSHGDGRGISLLLASAGASTAWLSRSRDNEQIPGGLLHPPTLKRDFAGITTTLISLLFILPHMQSYWFLHEVSKNVGPPQFPPGPLRSLYVGNVTNMLGPDCVAKMNEGINLVSSHCTPRDSLQYVSFNIYNFACGIRSPKESVLFWDNASTYSLEHHPPADDLRDTDFILVPKRGLALNDTSADWMSIYGYRLMSHYDTCDDTQFFTLYKQRALNSGNSQSK